MDDVTDQPSLSLVEDIIREKICLHTDGEIPYVTKQVCVCVCVCVCGVCVLFVGGSGRGGWELT